MINALEIPSDINLAAFSRFLSSRGVVHRVTEHGMNQVVWVLGEQERVFVRSVYSQYTSGEFELDEVPVVLGKIQIIPRVLSAVRRFPLTAVTDCYQCLAVSCGYGLGRRDY